MTLGLRAVWIAALGLAVVTTGMHAQTWRTSASSRQYRGETDLRVDLEFAAGTLQLRRGDAATLYHSRVRYDADRFASTTAFDTSADRLRVGVTSEDLPEDLDLDEYPQSLELALSPAVPLILDLEFGIAKADLDLGGLAVASAHVKTGGSESRIRFSELNRVVCDRLEIAVGAAELTAEQLGNARCRRVEFAGGAGEMILDFTGAWSQDFDTNAEVTMGLGSLTLRFPTDIGVSVHVSRFLASFEDGGFEKRGSRYVSPNYDRAPVKLDLEMHAVLGDVNVEWIDRR
jgi:hypothetical protein